MPLICLADPLLKTTKRRPDFRIGEVSVVGVTCPLLASLNPGLRAGNAPSLKFGQAPASDRTIRPRPSTSAMGETQHATTGFAEIHFLHHTPMLYFALDKIYL